LSPLRKNAGKRNLLVGGENADGPRRIRGGRNTEIRRGQGETQNSAKPVRREKKKKGCSIDGRRKQGELVGGGEEPPTPPSPRAERGQVKELKNRYRKDTGEKKKEGG